MGGLPTGTVNGFAVHPSNLKLMYVAMREGVFRSQDGGARWAAVAGGPKDAAAITVHSIRPEEVYVATAQGDLVSTRDGGRTWNAVQ